MIDKKLLIFSIIIGGFLTQIINSQLPGNVLFDSSSKAAAGLIGIGATEVLSMGFGLVVQYSITIGVVYMFFRGIWKKFER
ncbi:MAG: hypothetical protein ISS36_01200 [Candidatus Aenigmarchaeota archaeon]|nr:hypothetical protein [Candidatus Aenigmarchaeota archaeon]